MVNIRVYNINLLKDCRNDQYSGKLEFLATLIHDRDNLDLKTWDILGLNECWFNYDGKRNRTIVGKKIPLKGSLIDSFRCFTPDCLHRYFQNIDDIYADTNIYTQKGCVGYLARSNRFTVENGMVVHGLMGNRKQTKYSIVGTRLRLKNTGKILPFYCVHLPTDEGNLYKCVEFLKIFIASWWVQGDLTPLILGDFNFYKKNALLQSMMEGSFHAVHLLFGHDIKEHVWVGREDKFNSSVGKLEAISFNFLDEFTNIWDPCKSDYPIPIVEFQEPQ